MQHATTNHYAADRDRDTTRRALLAVIADGPIGRRDATRRLYGTDLVGASHAAAALGWLHNTGLVARAGGDRWRITPSGRAALALAHALDEQANR